MALIQMEGQEFPLDDDIAGNDEAVKAALRPLYPEIGNATIQRSNKDGQMVVTITKQAGRKGVQGLPGLQGSLGLLEELETANGAEVLELALSSVRTDGGTQTRQSTNYDVAREYAEAIIGGAQFPAVKVVFDGTDYWLYDGFHTTAAHHIAERETIRALSKPGTRREAVLLAVGANQLHGLRRTNEDKRRAVTILLQDEEWGQWSDREIGERAGVSHTFVGNIRRELVVPVVPDVSGNGLHSPTPPQSQERLAQRGGTTYSFQPAVTPEALKAQGQQTFEDEVAEPAVAEEGVATAELVPDDDDGPNGGPVTVEPGETILLKRPEGNVIEYTNSTLQTKTPRGVKVNEGGPPPPPGLKATPKAPPAPAPSPSPTPTPAAKPLPFDQSEITVTLVLRPDDGKDGGRPVFMTAQAVGCTPVVRILRLSQFWPWQQHIEDVLNGFRQQLPQPGKVVDASVGLAGSPAGEPVDRDRDEGDPTEEVEADDAAEEAGE